jgi:hypothetical protein
MIRFEKKSDPVERAWFLRSLTRDAFLIAVSTWLALFVLEFIKPGIASNYVSLTRGAAALFILALVHVSLRQPQDVSTKPSPFTRRDLGALSLVSLLAAAVVASVMPAFDLLTLLVISVTVLAIWIGSFLHREV